MHACGRKAAGPSPRTLASPTTPSIDVRSAPIYDAVVGLVAVDTRGVTGFKTGAHCDSVPGKIQTEAKEVAGSGVGSLQVGLLAPSRATARKEVDRTAVRGTVVRWVAVGRNRVAAFAGSTDGERIARECHAQ